MTFDILDYTDEQLAALTTVQMRLLRTAQKEKNELLLECERKKQEYYNKLIEAEALQSGLYEYKCAELDVECEREVELVRDDLIYNISISDPTPDGEGGENVGYIVDYSLSFIDRYEIVRSYYMSIHDPAERLAAYTADEVAKRYLDIYYTTLYNVLYQYL